MLINNLYKIALTFDEVNALKKYLGNLDSDLENLTHDATYIASSKGITFVFHSERERDILVETVFEAVCCTRDKEQSTSNNGEIND